MIGSIGGIQLLLTPLDQLPTEIAHLAPCYGAQLLQSPLGFFSMPSEVGITLGILQALYDQSIAWPKLHPTTLSQGRTLLHDLLVKLPIGGGGNVLLSHGGVSHDFLSLLNLVCLQGHRAGKQLCYACFSQAVSTMYSITSSTGWAPLASGLSGEVLESRGAFPNELLHAHR
jgi:hypothetical protein